MEQRNFRILNNYDISEVVRTITAKSSTFKRSVFNSMISNNKVSSSDINKYITFINNLLSYFDEYSKFVINKTKDYQGAVNRRIIPYDSIKSYVYGSYDYASIIQFLDGIIKKVDNNEFDDPDDVNDFFSFTVLKAFNDHSDSVAGLLDNILELSNYDNWMTSSLLEAKKFTSIKGYDKLFDSKSRVELFKSISKVIEFITDIPLVEKYIKTDDMNIFVAIVNNIIDYITYSLSIYSLRIIIISIYMEMHFTEQQTSIKESVVDNDSINVDSIASTSSIINDMDSSIVRDPSRFKEFKNIFKEFISSIGAGKYIVTSPYISKESITKNIFYSQLLDNELIDLLSNNDYEYNPDVNVKINEKYNMLKSCINNERLSLETTSTPKNEILHIIRGATSEKSNTLESFRMTAGDLYTFSMYILDLIKRLIEQSDVWSRDDRWMKLNSDIMIPELIRMSTDVYKDIASAALERAREIETEYNSFNKRIEKDNFNISIKVPGGLDREMNNSPTISSNAVPDTLRMSAQLMNLYSLPSFESMELYDDYVKSLPMFESDMYYSEAFNISAMVNAVLALIAGISKKWNNFYNDKVFQSAVNYVINRKEALLSLSIPGNSTMKVMPYKENINPPKEIWENLINRFKNVPDDAITSSEGEKAFIKSLYPNETIYNWFNTENNDNKSGAMKFRNYILFQDDINSVGSDNVQLVDINGDAIKKNLPKWIATVEGSRNLHDQLVKLDNDIQQAQNVLKTKLVNMTNNQNLQQQNQNAQAQSQAQQNLGQDQTQSQPAQNNQQPVQDMGLYNTLLTDIQNVIRQTWGATIDMFIEYLKADYNYIREAYRLGNKK